MRDKVVSAAEAVAIIQDGDALCTSGFVGIGIAEELLSALERRFIEDRRRRAISRSCSPPDRAMARNAG